MTAAWIKSEDSEAEAGRGYGEAGQLAAEYGMVDCEATRPGSVAA